MSKKLDFKIILSSISVILAIILMILSLLMHPRFFIKTYKHNITVNYKSNFSEEHGYVCYGNIINCNESEYSLNGEVNTNEIGTYDLKYTYTFDGKSIELEQKVTVKDIEKPNFIIEDLDNIVCKNNNVVNYNIKAIDNYDGDITEKIESKIVDDKIIYSIVDNSGNYNEISKDLYKERLYSFQLNNDDILYLNTNEEYVEYNASFVDFCGNDYSDLVTIKNNVDTSKEGEYTVLYEAKDIYNNEYKLTRKVIVNNNKLENIKNIYLTFDDGPSEYTNNLLDILDKYNVKATFFVTSFGINSGYKDSLVRAYNEGHQIGLHSKTHDYSYIYTSIDNYFEDLYAVQNSVKELTGYTSYIIRFPGGTSNTISKNYDGGKKIMTQLTNLVKEKGFRYFDWNIASGDAGDTTNSDEVYQNVIDSLIYENNVILQHDTKKFSIDAVERIIKYGQNNGYIFKTLDINSPSCEHTIYN